MEDGSAAPLVAPRRGIAILREAPDRLDAILRWCTEKDAGCPIDGDPPTIRGIVAHLGTLDRHHYLESAKRLASGAPSPELPGLVPENGADAADREIAELLVRFRHVRAQAVAFLEVVDPESWDRAGTDPRLGELTLSLIVNHWVRNDAIMMARLAAAGSLRTLK